jgi:hypothetical protein
LASHLGVGDAQALYVGLYHHPKLFDRSLQGRDALF